MFEKLKLQNNVSKNIECFRDYLKKANDKIRGFDEPIFENIKGIRGAPIRHPYMIATVLYLLKHLQKTKHLNILEIGSYVGSFLFTWAYALKTFTNGEGSIYSIDPLESFFKENTYSAGKISKVTELDEGIKFDFAYQMLRHNLKHISINGNCVHLRAISKDVLPILRDKYFHLIYVDGDHGYQGVRSDLLETQRLLCDGGILCGDDLEIQGDECDIKYAKENAHIDFIVDTKTNVAYHPGVTLAVYEVLGKVSLWDGFWAVQKEGERWQRVSLQDAPLLIPPHFSDNIKN